MALILGRIGGAIVIGIILGLNFVLSFIVRIGQYSSDKAVAEQSHSHFFPIDLISHSVKYIAVNAAKVIVVIDL